MPLEHHPLVKEFPRHRELIHRLKCEDDLFRLLFEAYHRVDREIFRIGRDIEPASDVRVGQLKRQRLYLEDRLLERLRAVSAGAA